MIRIIFCTAMVAMMGLPEIASAKGKGGGKFISSLFGGGSRAISRGTAIPYGQTAMTRAELRECLLDQNKLNDFDNDARNQTATRMKMDLETLGTRMDILELRGHSDNTAIDEYNGLVGVYNDKRDAYNLFIDDLNAEADIFNEGVNAFNAKCGGKYYYDDDMRAVRVEIDH